MALLTKQVERQLTVRLNLLDDAQDLLDCKLHMLKAGAKVTVTFFRMEKMIGDTEVGTYITETGEVEELDLEGRTLVLNSAYIPFLDIIELVSNHDLETVAYDRPKPEEAAS